MPNWIWIFVSAILFIYLGDMLRNALSKRKERNDKARAIAQERENRIRMYDEICQEINTPLSLVMAPLKKMREAELDPIRKETFNLMYRNALRINRTVNMVVDINKVTSHQMEMNFRETDIIFFIQDILQAFETQASNRNVKLNMKSALGQLNIWVDQGNFDKIIFNLIHHAFNYVSKRGSINVQISMPLPNNEVFANQNIREYVEICISYMGDTERILQMEENFKDMSSSSDKDLMQIFKGKKRNRRDSEDSSDFGSLSLLLSRELVRLEHGQLDCRVDNGLIRTTIRMPVGNSHLTMGEIVLSEHHKDLYNTPRFSADNKEKHDEVSLLDTPSPDDNTPHNPLRKTLLIVDDDIEMRNYLKVEFKSLYNIKLCQDGQEAWEFIMQLPPDLIITDHIMPKMDGPELCRRIRQTSATAHIPVIMLTTRTDDDSINICVSSGCNQCYSKPVSTEVLKNAVSQLFSSVDVIKGKANIKMLQYDYSTTLHIDSVNNQLMRQVIDTIKENISNPDFTVEELANKLNISRMHLGRKIKDGLSVTPVNLIKTIRLKQAAHLIVNNQVDMSEIATQVGFSSQSYFSSSFRQYFGMSPSEFKAKYSNIEDQSLLNKILE